MNGSTVVIMCAVGLTACFPICAQIPEPYPWHCDQGDACPVRYPIYGFDVRVSPTIYDHPNFTHQTLGRELDYVKAQLLTLTSYNGLPQSAVSQLIDSGLSI